MGVVAAPSGVGGASAGWCGGWAARRSYTSRRGCARERWPWGRPGRRRAPPAAASSATHTSRAFCEPAAPSTRQDARPSPDAEQPSDTHSPATPRSASTPHHDRCAASKTRPTHAPHTTTPQRHSQSRLAASFRACGQRRSHRQAAWSAPYEPCTTTADTAKTWPLSLPTKTSNGGDETSHLSPKGQTSLSHTVNWHIPLAIKSKRPAQPLTDSPDRAANGPNDRSRHVVVECTCD